MPLFFKDQDEFRKWLEKNHQTENEIIVGYYKISSGKPTMSWSESVDQAICFGWIDGIRKSIDNESYSNRFTPRRNGSTWSNVNIRKAEQLIEKGLMTKAGLDAFNKRKPEKSGIYSFENSQGKLPDEFEKIFQENKEAWEFFNRQAPSYKRTAIRWILSARLEETRVSRLNKTISVSENKKKIY